MTRFMVTPICAGELVTVTPAASSAAILSPALPLPPAGGGRGRAAVQQNALGDQSGGPSPVVMWLGRLEPRMGLWRLAALPACA